MSKTGPADLADPALTRSMAAQSKEIWDKCTVLIDKYHEDLEEWQRDRPTKNVDNLTRALQGNLGEREALWSAREALQVVASNLLTYKQKISNIEKVTSQMENEIINAPAGIKPTDRDTYQTRQILVLEKRNKLQLAYDVLTAYESRYKRLKSDYNEWADDDGSPVKRDRDQEKSPGRGIQLWIQAHLLVTC